MTDLPVSRDSHNKMNQIFYFTKLSTKENILWRLEVWISDEGHSETDAML